MQTEKAVQDGYDVRGFFFWVSLACTCSDSLSVAYPVNHVIPNCEEHEHCSRSDATQPHAMQHSLSGHHGHALSDRLQAGYINMHLPDLRCGCFERLCYELTTAPFLQLQSWH